MRGTVGVDATVLVGALALASAKLAQAHGLLARAAVAALQLAGWLATGLPLAS